jgi:LacI family transcriptional regulator
MHLLKRGVHHRRASQLISDSGCFLDRHPHLPLCDEYIRPGGFSTEGAHRAALEILQLPNPPKAVFSCNNRMTLGLMGGLKDLGLRCPCDVSVVGFDDFDWSELFTPSLTTIVQPSYEMRKRATEVLLQVIQVRDQHFGSREGNRVVLKAELLVRGSTAPPARVSGRPKHNPTIARSSKAIQPVAQQAP